MCQANRARAKDSEEGTACVAEAVCGCVGRGNFECDLQGQALPCVSCEQQLAHYESAIKIKPSQEETLSHSLKHYLCYTLLGGSNKHVIEERQNFQPKRKNHIALL
jgi:hypothetical protein